MTDKQRGDIKFFSRPGSTSFRVLLPVNFESTNEIEQAVSCSPDKTDPDRPAVLKSTQTVVVVGGGANEPAVDTSKIDLPDGWQVVPELTSLPVPPDFV